jgi:hypothetical protein
MADILFLAGKARGKLQHQASRKDPNIRLILGHAQLLDSLVMELSARKSTWSEEDAQEDDNDVDVDVGPEGGRCYPELEDSDDSDSESSDPDSDSDSDDSDLGPDWNSFEDFEQEGPGDWCEESGDDCADAESKAGDLAPMEFYQWEMAKPLAGGRPIQIGVHEARDEIES